MHRYYVQLSHYRLMRPDAFHDDPTTLLGTPNEQYDMTLNATFCENNVPSGVISKNTDAEIAEWRVMPSRPVTSVFRSLPASVSRPAMYLSPWCVVKMGKNASAADAAG